jgi:hypothetical protein
MNPSGKAIRRVIRDERGIAVATVLLLGFSLILLTSVVAFRSLVQSQSVHVDSEWELTLAVAEAGLDVGLDLANADESYTTGETAPHPFPDSDTERKWVVAAADARSPSDLGQVPGGEFMVIRPFNSEVVYSVGYVPTRSAPDRRVRAVRGRIGLSSEVGGWNAAYAVLSGGNLAFKGNPTVASGSSVGIHANGDLSIGGSSFIQSCISASGAVSVSGSYSQAPGCAMPGGQATVLLPIIDIRSLWSLSEYDMCPDGRVRAGPAHPTMGGTVTSVPCSGATLDTDTQTSPFRSWKYNGCCDSRLGAKWVYDNDIPFDGVYYFHEGSVTIGASPGSVGAPWQVTLLVAGSGTCPDKVGGDLSISGNPTMVPYPNTRNLLLGVDRDLEISGNPDLSGIMAVQEQLKINGASSIVEGAFIIGDSCDSAEDYVHESDWSGNPTVDNSGPVPSPFRATQDVPIVVDWAEL